MFKEIFLKHISETVGDSTEMSRFLDILKQLIRTPSVVGAEHSFFLSLKRELEEIGIQTTLHEGVLVAEGNDPDSGMISAHIDRHGLICTGPNEFQYAAFTAQNRGDLTGDSVAEKTYRDIIERFIHQRVQAYNPWSGSYIGLGKIDNAYFCERRGNLLFNVEGLEHLYAGTPVAFVDTLSYEEGHLSAQLDNVLSAAIILFLYERGYQGRAFFTAEEEAGKSWRFLLEWFRGRDICTDELLVLDTSPYPDRESADVQHIVLRNRDANAKFTSPLSQKITDICDDLSIKYGYKDQYIEALNEERVAQNNAPFSLGSTEMGRLVNASEGTIQGTTFQLPTTGYHTTSETVSMAAVIDAIKVLETLYLEERRV
ncbi:peptidase M42 [Sulfurovum sp.]|uniref:peptidase M42 n=1 Tax=Sulfurovum sp. TaxID=1969726 RepID=UPI003566DB7D